MHNSECDIGTKNHSKEFSRFYLPYEHSALLKEIATFVTSSELPVGIVADKIMKSGKTCPFRFSTICISCSKLSHTQVTVLDVYDDCFSVNLQSLFTTMQTSPPEKFLQSGKSTNELVLRLGQNEYEDINILISNADWNSKIPQLNPFTLQSFIKDKINRHTSIQNMKFTRQGKIILTTQDPVCATQLLNLESVLNIKVSTNVIWENITLRFLLYDIPTKVSLRENAEELTRNNGIEIVEMRRLVKQNNTRETSLVLVTKLGTPLPEYMKIWFTNQKIQSFIDRPRQCVKCYSFKHPSRVCEKTPICPSCGEILSGICQAPQKCINCQGEHAATSRGCPFYIKEQNILEFKGRNHLTTAEARRIYSQSAKFNYTAAVKANTPSNNIEGQINEKMETMLLKMNEKIESITQIINAKMEQQATMLVEMFERLVESLLQNLTAINKLGGETISPPRKKKSGR
ncbi:hypothetical protein AVEN_12811-1 [Araneus ventricosus]|uniref:Pre-C2HC domain-containing protein n=1 Tax=Araneus ventricosus TaxID=182803 RepID=A0A4Y2ABX9_ARAVE|nr:hypothetical protein AVEN_12811-1 [Araneus ventricosus]